MRNSPFKKLMSYMLVTALVIALIPSGLLTPVTASATSLDNGTWVNMPRYLNFGQYNGHNLRWRVLEITDSHADNPGNKTALLLLDDLLRQTDGQFELRRYQAGASSTGDFWRESGLRAFLNDSFYDQAFSSSQQDAILLYKHNFQGTGVFLLTRAEIFENSNYFADNYDRRVGNHAWWLRTVEQWSGINVVYNLPAGVDSNGALARYPDNIVSNTMTSAVRPAVRVNLEADYFDMGVDFVTGGGGFGSNPPTGITDVTGAAAAMYLFVVLSAALWGYIFLRMRKKNG